MHLGTSKTIEEALIEYAKIIDIPKDSFGKNVMLLYNGAQLDCKSKSTIGSIFRNTACITVYDLDGIIGSWTINFDASNGIKISMKIGQSKTIKDMMEAYANKIHVPKEAIGKDIIFIYNGENLNAKQNDTIEKVLRDKVTIIVYDMGNVMINMN